MRIVQHKPEKKGKKPQIPMWVPAWVKQELGFEPGDGVEWYIGEDDNGEKIGILRRMPKKEEGKEKEEEVMKDER